MNRFISLSNGYTLNVDEVSHIFEAPSVPQSGLEVYMKNGSVISIAYSAKAVFKEKFKEANK